MSSDRLSTEPVTWAVVPLSGDIDLASASTLRVNLAQATETTPAHVVVDLAKLDFIDSTGLGVLVGVLRRVRSTGGDIRMAAAGPAIERVFAVTGLDRVFRLFRTVEDAVTAPLGDQPTPDLPA
jgi:anti-sigma B factor antagonist